ELDLAEQYGCSRMTVNKALTQLANAGLIERRRKAGSYVAQPRAQSAVLDIHDIRDEVQSLGLPVVARVLCADPGSAEAAFEQLGGGPVVVKGCTAEVTHKSDLGLVRLGVRTRSQAGDAAREVLARMHDRGLSAPQVLVASMVDGLREVMVGAHVDATFGPVVLVGNGGKHVETLPDIAVLLPPFAGQDVEAAIRRLACAPLLDGVRGEPAVDVSGWVDIAVRLGAALVEPGSQLLAVDVNPLLLGRDAGAGVAVDATVVLGAARHCAHAPPDRARGV
ncbi:MAG: acetate--CoA ligase family protein, partial [Microbacterium sp.]|nr:acetate--CoA ligase family protein [Microbacterium sp.]